MTWFLFFFIIHWRQRNYNDSCWHKWMSWRVVWGLQYLGGQCLGLIILRLQARLLQEGDPSLWKYICCMSFLTVAISTDESSWKTINNIYLFTLYWSSVCVALFWLCIFSFWVFSFWFNTTNIYMGVVQWHFSAYCLFPAGIRDKHCGVGGQNFSCCYHYLPFFFFTGIFLPNCAASTVTKITVVQHRFTLFFLIFYLSVMLQHCVTAELSHTSLCSHSK